MNLITIRARKRFKTAVLALTAVIVSIAPVLSMKGWIYLAGAVALLVGVVAVCDALDLATVYRDFSAWRKDRDAEAERILARRRLKLLP